MIECGTTNDWSEPVAAVVANEWGDLPVERRMIRSGDLEIAVTLAGNGPALVLIHGIGSRGISWVPVAEELAREYRLVILDLRGHGASTHPEHGYLLADYAADLEAVLRELGLDRPLIMGHSLGGMTTLEWAIGHPATAAALVIEDSPMNRGGEGVAELFDGWIALSKLSVAEAVAYYTKHNPEWSSDERHRRAVSITSVAPGVFEDMRADMLAQGGVTVISSYAEIESPALLVYGDLPFGGLVAPFHATAFTSTLKHASATHIPFGTHGLHRDNKEKFLEAVLPFLREHSAEASWMK